MDTEISVAPKLQNMQIAPVEQKGGCEQYLSLVSQYSWNVNIAMAIMQAESQCNPNATNVNTNGTMDAGLFQVNDVHVPNLIGYSERFEPSANVKAAFAVYEGSGWKAWSVYNNGKYMKYL